MHLVFLAVKNLKQAGRKKDAPTSKLYFALLSRTALLFLGVRPQLARPALVSVFSLILAVFSPDFLKRLQLLPDIISDMTPMVSQGAG